MKNECRGGITPTCIINDKELNCYERLIMIFLIDRENGLMAQGKEFYTTQKFISINTEFSLSTVKRAIKVLNEKGYINIIPRKMKHHLVNYYSINWEFINKKGREFKFIVEDEKKEEMIELKEAI